MDKIKIAALVSGGGTNLGAILENIDSGYISNGEVVTVISSNPNAFALERAAKRGINAVTIRKRDFASAKEYESAMTAHLHKFGVELVVLAGFMVILGPDFINEFRGRIMNIHPALIPSFCGEGFYGLKVHEAALQKGVKLTGATVHFVTEEPDAGPIILQKAVEILDDDTPEILQKRVMEEAEWKLFPEAVKLFCENKLEIVDNKVRRKDK